MQKNLNLFLLLISFLLLPAVFSDALGQYFGRNKVLYRGFDFRVYESPHFELYTYLHHKPAVIRLARSAEHWYQLHRSVLGDSFTARNPLLIYNHHADFQQTRAIQGEISAGTGGVTESLKNRVVMPLMFSNAQTDHVLGHELVHAFQYHLLRDSLNIQAMNKLPLWLVEGMAEYLSLGPADVHTSMWLRSALAEDELPRLKDLTYRADKYFPYRWGHAFWSYLAGTFGDRVIRSFFMESARKGYGAALKNMFGMDEKTFCDRWHQDIRSRYLPVWQTKQGEGAGRSLINKSTSGKLNILPSISPDGRYIAFWTEKNGFSLDLYLADAVTGKLLERVTTTSHNRRIDQYSSFESSIAWSPDSKRIAFVAFAKGENRLLIAGIDGRIREELQLGSLSSFVNPAWSPDGQSIVVSGMMEGQPDLYAYHFATGRLKQLTRDLHSELTPSWSPDGKYLVFSSDRNEGDRKNIPHRFSHQLFLLNMHTGEQTGIDVFPGSNNLNPVFSGNGLLYFLSDRDGYRNLYSYDQETNELLQRSDAYTGITGITLFAPAISVAKEENILVYNYFNSGGYIVYRVDPDSLLGIPVEAFAASHPASLPAGNKTGSAPVLKGDSIAASNFSLKEIPYRSRFRLDQVGSMGIGVQAGGYTTGLAGGINGVFTDMTGDHLLFGALSLNGDILDIAGQFAYVNQKKRFNWGVSLSHIPYLSGAQFIFPDTFITSKGDSIAAWNYSVDLLRTFEDQFSVFASYPFSPVRRVEAGASFARYYYRMDRYSEYYERNEEYFLGSTRKKQDVPQGFQLAHGYLALVGDNSFFGVASPLDGHRFRLEAAQYVGIVKMTSVLADYRKYTRLRPFSLASRILFMGRYGRDAAGGLLPPLFLGYSSLIRGYEAAAYATPNGSGPGINDLTGSSIGVANLELRLPLTGPERMALKKSRFLFSEISLFSDAGIAWGESSFLQNGDQRQMARNARVIMSSGISLRLNIFGYLVIEPFYAIPWQNGGWQNRSAGLNILPGW